MPYDRAVATYERDRCPDECTGRQRPPANARCMMGEADVYAQKMVVYWLRVDKCPFPFRYMGFFSMLYLRFDILSCKMAAYTMFRTYYVRILHYIILH